jgi:hypothetical protein
MIILEVAWLKWNRRRYGIPRFWESLVGLCCTSLYRIIWRMKVMDLECILLISLFLP